MEKYLTSEQVATLLQVHQFTVLKYLKAGKLKGVKIGRVYRIKESDVEKFLNDHAVVKHKKEDTQNIERTEDINPKEETASTVTPNIHKVKFQDDEQEEQKEESIYYKI